MNLPIDLRKAWVRASVLDISREKISEPASIVKGVSSPRLLAIPMLHTQTEVIRETHLDFGQRLSAPNILQRACKSV